MICIYGKNETNFAHNGLCVLSPTVCLVSEEAGGSYSLHLEHPMDEAGKWLLIQEEMIIQAPVPERVIPQITLPEVKIWQTNASADVYSKLPKYKQSQSYSDVAAWAGWLHAYNVGARVKHNGKVWQAQKFNVGVTPGSDSSIWAYVGEANGGGTYDSGTVIETVAANKLIFKIADYDGTWMQVRTQQGNVGYIERAKCTETQQTQSGEVIPSRTIQTQRFRIYHVEGDDDTHTVIAEANHISYDFRGNSLYDCRVTDAEPMTAIALMQGSLVIEDDRDIICNVTGKKITEDWSFKNPINVLLDPDSGLLGNISGALVRDNEDFFLLDNSEPRKGASLAYGRNLIGVKWSRDVDGVITRVIPRCNKGTDEYVYIDDLFVDSEIIDQYAYPRIEVLDCAYSIGEEYTKPDGTTATWTEESAKAQMEQDARDRFEKDHVDGVDITLEVHFLLLGETEEYRQYRKLETVLLYDEIQVITGDGVKSTAQVIGYEYDSILERYNAIDVGNITKFKRSRLPGYRVVNQSITYKKLSPDLINRIRTGNASGSSNAGSQGSSQSGGEVPYGIDIADDLTTDSATSALSAKQGKLINDLILKGTEVSNVNDATLSSNQYFKLYRFSSSATNKPWSESAGGAAIAFGLNATYYTQIAAMNTNGTAAHVYTRPHGSNGFGDWTEIT